MSNWLFLLLAWSLLFNAQVIKTHDYEFDWPRFAKGYVHAGQIGSETLKLNGFTGINRYEVLRQANEIGVFETTIGGPAKFLMSGENIANPTKVTIKVQLKSKGYDLGFIRNENEMLQNIEDKCKKLNTHPEAKGLIMHYDFIENGILSLKNANTVDSEPHECVYLIHTFVRSFYDVIKDKAIIGAKKIHELFNYFGELVETFKFLHIYLRITLNDVSMNSLCMTKDDRPCLHNFGIATELNQRNETDKSVYMFTNSKGTNITIGYKHTLTAPALYGFVRDPRADIRSFGTAMYGVLGKPYPTDQPEINNKFKNENTFADGIRDVCHYRPESPGHSSTIWAYYKKKYDLKRRTKIFDLSVVTAIQQIEEISKFEMGTPPYDKIKEICDNVRME